MIINKSSYENCFLDKPFEKENIVLYPLARQALYRFLESQSIREVYLPKHCAMGVYLPYEAAGFKINTYAYDEDFNIEVGELKPNTIFHYIHPMGLFIKKNILRLKDFQSNDILVIDDRALTLPVKPYSEEFSAEVYCMYKCVHVGFGGYVKSNIEVKHETTNALDSEFLHLLNRYFKISSSSIIKYCNTFFLKVFYKLLLSDNKRDIEVNENWREHISVLNSNEFEYLKQIDVKKINDIRMKHAENIFENIDERFLLTKDKSAYCSQCLIGFPVFVEDPMLFKSHLMKKGVLGFTFTREWDPMGISKQQWYFDKHFILPLNHNLSSKEIEKVIDATNSFLN